MEYSLQAVIRLEMNTMDIELVAMSQQILPGDKNPMGIAERAASVCYDSKPTKQYRIAKSCMDSGHMSVMEHVVLEYK